MLRPPPRSQNLRTALLVVGSVAFVGIVAAVLVNSADPGDQDNPAPVGASANRQGAAKAKSVKLVMGPVVIQNTGFPTKVRPPVRRAVMAATQRYFDRAIQSPLRTGTVNPAYSQVFAPSVNGFAARRDRATLTEAATGPIRAPVRIQASRVRIDGLGDPTGKVALVSTSFNIKVNAGTPTGKLTIQRHTELTFANESGRWRVTAYRVTVRRSIGPKTMATTAGSGPGTPA